MSRVLTLVVALAVAGPVVADLAPPKGQKRVPLEYKIATEKEYPGWAFYAVSGGDKVESVKLDPKKPASVKAGGGRYRTANLVAVPKEAAKKYDSEKDFLKAVAAGKVEGMLQAKANFSAFTVVKDNDDRKLIVLEYKVEKLDPKDGIVLTEVKPGAAKEGGSEGPPGGEEDGVTAYTPGSGIWVAGLAATAGLVLGGLWLAGRRNR